MWVERTYIFIFIRSKAYIVNKSVYKVWLSQMKYVM